MVKFKKLLAEILLDIPDVLYHATFNAFLPSIKKHGLIPGGKRYRNFIDSELGIYLGNDPEYVANMLEASENDDIPDEWFDKIIIIGIDTSKLNLSLLDIDPNIIPPENDDTNEIQSYIYRGNISPNTILSIKKYD